MAPGFRIDLRVLGERLPDGVQRFGRKAAKAAEKPVGIAHDLMYPETLLEPGLDKVANPIVATRFPHLTIATRAHILGIADLPAMEYENSGSLSTVLLRIRVERPEGDAETCVRQCLPEAIRRITPGSSLRALAHETDPRIAVFDWNETGTRLGMKLSWPETLDQYAWPDRGEWPAVDVIEVRDGIRHRGTLDRRRAEWAAGTAHLVGASSRGARLDGRQQWQLDLDLPGRRVSVKERVPDLALAKLVGRREGAKRLGGVATTIETVVNEGAAIAVLAGPGGEVAADWEATLNQPEWRAT